MSAPLPEGTVHLLVADDSLAEQHAYRSYLAVCGALVPASSLPPSLCPDGLRLRPPVLPAVPARGRPLER